MAPTASFAFGHGGGGGGGGHMGGGGFGGHMGGGFGGHMGGGGFGGHMAAPGMGAGFGHGAGFAASRGAFVAGPGAVAAARPGWNGGWHSAGWNGGWHGDHFHHRHFFPGVAFAVGGGYYGPDYYYDYGPDYTYQDDGYDTGTVAVTPETGGDASYCAQRYRSWDPGSGTYLGYDGLRHPCP
jgi:hypothetical protein